MELNEIETIKKCQAGNLSEFGVLYDAYIKKIYNFVYYKTFNKETAEDLTSKTFFKALKSIKSFDLKSEGFSGWIYKIARNTVIDFYRTNRNLQNIDDIWDLRDNFDLQLDIDNKKKVEEIRKYLKKLKTSQREIVILRIWEGYSYREVAEIVGKSEESCKMSFSRTIKKLKTEMPIALFISFIINY